MATTQDDEDEVEEIIVVDGLGSGELEDEIEDVSASASERHRRDAMMMG